MNKIFNKDHIFVQICYYALTALTFAFGTLTLLERGFNSTQIGRIIALADLIGFIIQMILPNILDNSDKVNVFEVTLYVSIILLFIYVLNFVLTKSSLFLAIIFILYLALVDIMGPLIDSFSTIINKSGFSINFGIARALGSLSYAVVCFIFGYLTENFTYRLVPLSLFVAGSLFIIVLCKINKHYKTSTNKVINNEDTKKISLKQFISNHTNFIFISLGYCLIISSYILTENFTLLIVENIGGGNLDSGLIQGLKAVFEVPIIYAYANIEKKFSLKTIITVSCFSFILKAMAFTYSKTLLPIYIAQSLQALSFGLMIPAMVSYIEKNMHKNEIARSHGIQGLFRIIFNVILNDIGGRMIDNSGVITMCKFSQYMIILGSAILIVALQDKLFKQKRQS